MFRSHAALQILGLVVVFFVASRVVIRGVTPARLGDVTNYALDAYFFNQSEHTKADVYELRGQTIEYPPLALYFMLLPMMAMSSEVRDSSFAVFLPAYHNAYYNMMLLLDILLFMLVAWLIWGQTGGGARFAFQCGVYIFASMFLHYFVLTRLDPVLGLLLLAGCVALTKSPVLGFAVLAAAINFKLVPLLCVPLWAIATIPSALAVGSKWELLRAITRNVVIIMAFTVLLFVPFYLTYGGASLEFFSYHKLRSIQIESLYSSVLLAMRAFGVQVTSINGGFGSIDLGGDYTYAARDLANVLSPATAIVASLGVLILWMYWARRTGNKKSLVTANFPLFISFNAATIMLNLLTAKVFSPQYLLWILPFIPLMVAKTPIERWVINLLFLGTCFITMFIFPYSYAEHIRNYGGPSGYGALLLIGRNLVFLLCTLWSCHGVVQQALGYAHGWHVARATGATKMST